MNWPRSINRTIQGSSAHCQGTISILPVKASNIAVFTMFRWCFCHVFNMIKPWYILIGGRDSHAGLGTRLRCGRTIIILLVYIYILNKGNFPTCLSCFQSIYTYIYIHIIIRPIIYICIHIFQKGNFPTCLSCFQSIYTYIYTSFRRVISQHVYHVSSISIHIYIYICIYIL